MVCTLNVLNKTVVNNKNIVHLLFDNRIMLEYIPFVKKKCNEKKKLQLKTVKNNTRIYEMTM